MFQNVKVIYLQKTFCEKKVFCNAKYMTIK